MKLSKKKAWKHIKQRCPDKLCGKCMRRTWLGKKWGNHLDEDKGEEARKA